MCPPTRCACEFVYVHDFISLKVCWLSCESHTISSHLRPKCYFRHIICLNKQIRTRTTMCIGHKGWCYRSSDHKTVLSKICTFTKDLMAPLHIPYIDHSQLLWFILIILPCNGTLHKMKLKLWFWLRIYFHSSFVWSRSEWSKKKMSTCWKSRRMI